MFVRFFAEATITQELEIIDPSFTEEEIIKELNSGDLLTTLCHRQGKENCIGYYKNGEKHIVAKIISTDAEEEDCYGFHIKRKTR